MVRGGLNDEKFRLKLPLQHFRSESLSLRKRFLLYIISAISTFLALAMVLMNLFGFINSANAQIMRDLDAWLANSADSIEHDYDELAACAISFSHQLETQIQNFLIEQQPQFSDLRDNAQALTDLQQELYDTVYLNMQVAPASGTFYILNTTVNSTSEEPRFNGIYLKYVNLSSENTVNNDFTLYRGSYATGKENNLTFHSGWNNENSTDFFEDCDSVFSDGVHYALSTVAEIPNTWENARYIYVPLRDRHDQIIGVCGFEISDLLFRLSHKLEDPRWGQLVCGLIDRHQGNYYGQFNSTRYQAGSINGGLRILSKKDYTQFDFGTEDCVGVTKEILLGNGTFTVAVMMLQMQYQKFVRNGQLQNTILFLILGILALATCIILSHRYVSPILKRIEQVKANETGGDPTHIWEIEDLFAFLAARDEAYETRLEALEQERQAAETNATQTQKDYETALRRLDLVQGELEQLAAAQHREIVLDE